MKQILIFLAMVMSLPTGCQTAPVDNSVKQAVRYGVEKIDGVDIFYREAGDPSNPKIVLLHGFPSSSHMYRKVLAELSDKYYLIAPDYPGFGNSGFPSRKEFSYTFDNLSKVVEKLLKKKKVNHFYMMIQDYGAPIGFRIATKNPEKIKGIITQNGNAYVEGIDKKTWAPIMKYWETRSPKLGKTIAANVFNLQSLKWQYTHGTKDPSKISPDNWNLDYASISRKGQRQVQLDLFYDYQNNLKLYPKWQKYLKDNQPPVLVVWGKNDAFFPVTGAEGFKEDVENVDYHILDTGHFALEEKGDVIIQKMRTFLKKQR